MKLLSIGLAAPSTPSRRRLSASLLLASSFLSNIIQKSAAFVQEPPSRPSSALYAGKQDAERQQRALLQARLDMERNFKKKQKTPPPPIIKADKNDEYSFVVGILGDLHIDPRKMEDYEIGRQHFVSLFDEAKSTLGQDRVALVSLGDLGESKNCDHNPDNPFELFAGTTICHAMAAEYLSSFGVPYEVIGGNHDLEGIDEFDTDAKNLRRFLKLHNKPTPQFCRQVAEKTLLVGLSSTVFRDAKYTSHEVIIDQDQIRWFEDLVASKPADEGWRIFVFSHAPPNGSGIRIIQENHVVNGCCWLNHSDEQSCRKFIEIVREHRCIKGWFSGHFHLGQDYQDSIMFPTIDPLEGPYPNRGSCVFAQRSVMRAGSSRDGRQQSRLLRGTKDWFEVCTTITRRVERLESMLQLLIGMTLMRRVGVYAHEDEAYDHDNYFRVYQPQMNDHGYVCAENDEVCLLTRKPITKDTVAWWRICCGRVLGVVNGMMLEFDRSTLAPLGLVLPGDELIGKQVAIVESGLDECMINFESEEGMEGADCADTSKDQYREQAVLVFDDDGVTVIQPNADGSYW
ncbi:hypothetical protein ACHAW6_009831 [Cyclotella cf. meneghiniana]